MMIHVIVTLAVLLAVASFAMAQGGPAEDEIDRDALYASVTKMLAETDTAAVVEHLQTLGEPNAAAMAWSKLVLDLYHKGKNLPAVVAIARAGTQYALAEARRVDATNPELAADLRSRGKAMAYNLASFTWPGWSAPGIEPTRGDMLIGLDAARVSLRLARELKKGPVPESISLWAVGAHQMTLGDADAAIESFTEAKKLAGEGGDTMAPLLHDGYIGITQATQPGNEAEGRALFDKSVTALKAIDHEDAKFYADQLETVAKYFLTKTPTNR